MKPLVVVLLLNLILVISLDLAVSFRTRKVPSSLIRYRIPFGAFAVEYLMPISFI